MANPFDQFDVPAPASAAAPNPFDQFDAPAGGTDLAQMGADALRSIAQLPEVAQRRAAADLASLESASAPPPGRTLGEAVAGGAKALAQGGVQGLNMLLDAPVHLANNAPRALNPNIWLINKILGRDAVPYAGAISDNPLLPSDVLHAPDRALGARDYQPDGLVERILNRTGQEIGASAVPTIGALYAGGRLGVAGAQAAMRSENPLKAVGGAMAEAAAVNPVGVAGRETSGAVAAGLGAGTAGEAARAVTGDEHNPTADLVGAILGTTALAAARPIVGAAKSMAGTAIGSTRFADDVAREAVANDVLSNSTTAQRQVANGVDPGRIDAQPLADQLRRPSAVEEAIPGYQADLADRSGDPGLAAFVFNKTAARPGLDTGRRAANQAAVEDRMAELAPTGSAGQFRSDLQSGVDARLAAGDTAASEADATAQRLIEAIRPRQTPQARGAAVRTGVDDALETFVAGAREQHAAAGRAADAAMGRLAPGSDPAVRGDTVRGALEGARDQARQRTADAYAQTDIGSRVVDYAPLTQAVDQTLQGMTAVERGLVPQGLIDRVTRLGRAAEDGTAAAPARLQEATDLRSELDRAQRNALADPRAENGGRNAARVIGQMQDHVEDFIGGNLSEAERAAFQAARGARYAEAESFGRSGDPVAAAVARRPGGQPQMRDERVAGSFVNQASEQPLTRLFQEADTPAVRGAIRDEIASRLPAEARGDPERLDAFLRDYEIPLRQFPGLRDEVATAAATRRGVDTAEAAVDARRQEFAGGSRAVTDVSARRADGTPSLLDEQIPDRFVNEAGNRDLDALFARADTPAVRGALEDQILGRVEGSANRPDAMRRQVEALREPLSRFPGLRERLLETADAGAARDTARTAADATRRDLTTPGRSPEATYLKFDDARSVDAMRSVISNARPEEAAQQLIATAGGSRENARAALWELVKRDTTTNGGLGASGRQETNGLKGAKLFSDPKFDAVAKVLYADAPEQLADARAVFEALSNAGASTRARRPGSSGTPQAMKSGYDAALSASSIASRIRSVNRNQVSVPVTVIDVVSTWLRRRSAQIQSGAIERLMDEVIQSPELAARLLEDYNPANYAAKRRELLTVGGVRATEAVKLLDEANDEQQRPEVAAVRRAGAR